MLVNFSEKEEVRIWSLRVETSRYIGLPSKALENSIETFCPWIAGNYLKVCLSVTLKSHVTSNTSTVKMKEQKTGHNACET